MTEQFVNPSLGKAAELGISLYEETAPLELRPGASFQDLEIVIRAVYKQVLGNAYVMESERLSILESPLKNKEVTVREFVRQVAQSELHRSRFFENCPRYRAIELNFKHLLGRAPESYEEMQLHSQILDQEGYASDIDSYINSDEYQDAFGENIVPYYRGYKTQSGKRMVEFTYLFKLLRGASSSDKNVMTGNRSRLNQSLIANTPTAVTLPSSVGTYGGLTDVNKLLAELFKPKPSQDERTSSYQDYTPQTEAFQKLKQECDEQAQLIGKLQSQLTQLSASASLGVSELSKWQSLSPTTPNSSDLVIGAPFVKITEQSNSYESLQKCFEEQKKAIATLEAKITEVSRFAAIGEARLNKWRNRTFSN